MKEYIFPLLGIFRIPPLEEIIASVSSVGNNTIITKKDLQILGKSNRKNVLVPLRTIRQKMNKELFRCLK